MLPIPNGFQMFLNAEALLEKSISYIYVCQSCLKNSQFKNSKCWNDYTTTTISNYIYLTPL